MLINIDKLITIAEAAIPAEERASFETTLRSNIKSVSVAMFIFTTMLFLTIIFGALYRNSTKGRTEDKKENAIE